jgi:transposase
MTRRFRPKSPPLLVGEVLPAALDAKEMARAFGKSLNTIYDWHRDGKLRRFELRKPMTSKRWSGKLVQVFLEEGAHGALRQMAS